MFLGRFDQLRGEAGLAKQDPDGRHGWGSWAKVKRERGFSRIFAQSTQNRPNRCLVDFAKLGWASELLVNDLDAGLRSNPQPFRVGRDHTILVVRKQKGFVEGTGFEGLRDRADSDLGAFGRRTKISFAKPGNEDFSHAVRLQGVLLGHKDVYRPKGR